MNPRKTATEAIFQGISKFGLYSAKEFVTLVKLPFPWELRVNGGRIRKAQLFCSNVFSPKGKVPTLVVPPIHPFCIEVPMTYHFQNRIQFPLSSIPWKITTLGLLFCLWPFFAGAESLGTYNDCKPCPGNIVLEPSEVRPLLDTGGMGMIRKFSPETERTIKIDVDGNLPEGDKQSADDGYEIKIESRHGMFYIRGIQDGSYIHLFPDQAGARNGGFLGWNPEIFIKSADDNQFNQWEEMETAWNAVQESQAYRWATNYVAGAKGGEPLADRIKYTLKRLTEEK